MKSSAPESGVGEQALESPRQRLDDRQDRMPEVLDDEVLDFRRGELRLDVDGDAVVRRVVDEANLIVRALSGAEPDLDGFALQHSVSA